MWGRAGKSSMWAPTHRSCAPLVIKGREFLAYPGSPGYVDCMLEDLTPDEVASHSFEIAKRGYDRDSVHAFLKEIAAELERLRTEPRHGPGSGSYSEDIRRELETVSTDIEGIVSSAREAAEGLRTRAAAEASKWRDEADADARKWRKEAEEEARSLRESADSYSERTIADADDYVRRQKEDIEAQASRKRAEADTYSKQTRDAADLASAQTREAAETDAAEWRTAAQIDANRTREEADAYLAETRMDADTFAEHVRSQADSYDGRVRAEADQYDADVRREADLYAARIREEADEYADNARTEAEVIAENTRSEADEYDADVRREADLYAARIRDEADQYAHHARTEAEVNAENTKSEADTYARQTGTSADEYAKRTQKEADAYGEKVRSEAERAAEQTRAQADTYDTEVRAVADTYSLETRAEADAYGSHTRAEADAYRDKTRAEAEKHVHEVVSEVERTATARREAFNRQLQADELQAKATAEGLRRGLWDEGVSTLAAIHAEGVAARARNQEDALRILAEAEREAHRLVSQAKRSSEEERRMARSESERLISEAQSRHDEILAAAQREAELAQERARALERRRIELMGQLENAQAVMGRLESELDLKDQPIAPPVVSTPSFVDDRVDADELAAEVAGLRLSQDVEILSADADPDSGGDADVADATRAIRSDLPRANGNKAPKRGKAAEADNGPKPSTPGGKDEAFSVIRSGSVSGAVSGTTAASDGSSLARIQRRAVDAVQARLKQLQTGALEEVRVDAKTWLPDLNSWRSSLDPLLEKAAKDAYRQGCDEAGNAPSGTPAILEIEEFAEDLAQAVSDVVAEARIKGEGSRQQSAGVSRVFRDWRTDEVENRIGVITRSAYASGRGANQVV